MFSLCILTEIYNDFFCYIIFFEKKNKMETSSIILIFHQKN